MTDNLKIATDYLKQCLVHGDEVDQLTSLFNSEIKNYCELVHGMNRNSFGIVIKGNGEGFSKRNAHLLESRFPGRFINHYYWLADFFEHKGGLSKFEWQKNKQGKNSFSQSCYFRRRPQVHEMLNRYASIGISQGVLNQLSEVARIVDKNSIHFVASSFSEDLDIIHKWYFSQFVDQSSYNVVLSRILYVLELFAIDRESIHLFLSNYTRLVSFRKSSTLFISFSFNAAEIVPSVKVDLTEVDPADCMPLFNGGNCLQNMTDHDMLSYLGIRFFRNRKISLKCYVSNCSNPLPVLPVSVTG